MISVRSVILPSGTDSVLAEGRLSVQRIHSKRNKKEGSEVRQVPHCQMATVGESRHQLRCT